MLPITTPYKISWQGSTGASGYIIERKVPFLLFFSRWEVIDSNASDADVNYRPLYSDTLAEPGTPYSYRIRARNSSGISGASNVAGPVIAPDRLLVDEFEDTKKMAGTSSGIIILHNKENIRSKEDGSRLSGSAGDSILYQLPARVTSIQVDAFYTAQDRGQDLKFSSGISGHALSSAP